MTMMIAVPTGTKIYNYMVTMHRYTDHMITAKSVIMILLLTVFVILFSFGGATGVILGNAMVDIVLHDTYYVVAHFHYVLSLGTSISIVMGIFIIVDMFLGLGIGAGVSYVASTAGLSTITIALISLSLIFFSLHYLGFNTMPRRYVDYSDNIRLHNRIATMMLVAFLITPVLPVYMGFNTMPRRYAKVTSMLRR